MSLQSENGGNEKMQSNQDRNPRVSPHENKWRAGVLGATGIVGQRLVKLLAGHPWFELAEVAASERSSGRTYAEAVRWHLETPIPEVARDLVVKGGDPALDCDFVFSALDSSVAGPVEEDFAREGYPVVSNSRNHRMDADVPLLIPEVNAAHLDAISLQQKNRGYDTGFIVTNPNCSTAGLVLVLKPLADAFGLEKLFVVTLQPASGAGYPGVPSLDILGNVVPFISGEEEKMETEPQKLLGKWDGSRFIGAGLGISAHCNRLPVEKRPPQIGVNDPKKSPAPPRSPQRPPRFRRLRRPRPPPNTPKNPLCLSRKKKPPPAPPRRQRRQRHGR